MDLGAGKRLETVDAKLLGKSINARVLEELVAVVVDGGDRGVGF